MTRAEVLDLPTPRFLLHDMGTDEVEHLPLPMRGVVAGDAIADTSVGNRDLGQKILEGLAADG